MEQITQSPITTESLKPFLEVEDFMVSHKKFQLVRTEKSDLLITSPRPANEKLGAYYKSETYISHTDANKTLFDKIYQTVKRYTLKNKLKLINSFNTPTKTILDVGCGTGDFLKVCQNHNWQVTAIEPNQDARKLAEEKLNSTILDDLLKLNQENQFDIITLWHVLEHVPNLEEYIVQLKKLLKPTGRLIIAVPNHKCYDAQYYKSFWAAYDVPRHLWHFSPKSIEMLFQKINLKLEKTLPMKFDAFYVSLLSEENKTGRKNPIKAFWIGLRSNFKAKAKNNYSSLIYILKK